MKTDAVHVSLDEGADLKVRDSVRVGRSGTHPEYGEVLLVTEHNADGIVYSLYDDDGNELKSGWSTPVDILENLQ